MAHHKLSEGALAIIMSGGTIEDPVMQVLGSKKIVGNADKERYRLLVSDGKYQISFAMIATQINEKITSGELSVNSVIKVKKFITSMINNGGKGDRRVLVILDMDILARGDQVGEKIGRPVGLPDDPAELAKIRNGSTNGHSGGASTSGLAAAAKSTPAPAAPSPKPKISHDVSLDNSVMAGTLTVPIINLSPYSNKWVIKVRVTNKSPIRTWSNSRGDGQLFSLDLADESGEIRATAFRDLVDKFHPTIEVDKVYYIAKCQVKIANKKFSNLKSDYELTFTNETTVTPCYDEVTVPKATYNFTPIDKIVNQEPGSIIDVLGIIKSVGDMQVITVKATSRELKKREIILLDQTNNSVCLTLWGTEAENFIPAASPLLAIRGAKVGEFGGGKNISCLVSSTLKVDPDVPEAHRLLGWYEQEGKSKDPVNISAKTGVGSMRADWHNIADVKERKLGNGDTPDYYQLKATVILINSNNIMYKACPQAECNKKVLDLENGQFRCEKCAQEFDTFKYRMIMSCNIADWSDNQWISMFASEAEKIIGMTSQELGEQVENDKENLINICNQAHFTEYIFRCRAKLESFNDETRLKTVAVKVEKINYKEYHSFLVSNIKQNSGIDA